MRRSIFLLFLFLLGLVLTSPEQVAAARLPDFQTQALELHLTSALFSTNHFFLIPRLLHANSALFVGPSDTLWHSIMGMAVIIWNPAIKPLISAADLELLRTLPYLTREQQAGVMRDHWRSVSRSARDQANAYNGRTVYLHLQQPIDLNGRRYTDMRLKGVRARSTQMAQPYGTSVYATHVNMEGVIEAQPARSGILGGLSSVAAQREYHHMIGNAIDGLTDAAVSWQEYDPTLRLPLGFVIAAMEGIDTRLRATALVSRLNREESLGWDNVKNASGVFPVDQALELATELGRVVRVFHDRGRFHHALRFANIGVVWRDGKPHILLRDLEALTTRARLTGNRNARRRQEATHRLIDLERVLRDFRDGGMPFIHPDGYLIERFLSAYFSERLPDDFETIVAIAKRPSLFKPFLQLENRETPRLGSLNVTHADIGPLVTLWNALYDPAFDHRLHSAG